MSKLGQRRGSKATSPLLLVWMLAMFLSVVWALPTTRVASVSSVLSYQEKSLYERQNYGTANNYVAWVANPGLDSNGNAISYTISLAVTINTAQALQDGFVSTKDIAGAILENTRVGAGLLATTFPGRSYYNSYSAMTIIARFTTYQGASTASYEAAKIAAYWGIQAVYRGFKPSNDHFRRSDVATRSDEGVMAVFADINKCVNLVQHAEGVAMIGGNSTLSYEDVYQLSKFDTNEAPGAANLSVRGLCPAKSARPFKTDVHVTYTSADYACTTY